MFFGNKSSQKKTKRKGLHPFLKMAMFKSTYCTAPVSTQTMPLNKREIKQERCSSFG